MMYLIQYFRNRCRAYRCDNVKVSTILKTVARNLEDKEVLVEVSSRKNMLRILSDIRRGNPFTIQDYADEYVVFDRCNDLNLEFAFLQKKRWTLNVLEEIQTVCRKFTIEKEDRCIIVRFTDELIFLTRILNDGTTKFSLIAVDDLDYCVSDLYSFIEYFLNLR